MIENDPADTSRKMHREASLMPIQTQPKQLRHLKRALTSASMQGRLANHYCSSLCALSLACPNIQSIARLYKKLIVMTLVEEPVR